MLRVYKEKSIASVSLRDTVRLGKCVAPQRIQI